MIERLKKQLDFIKEIDRIKTIFRKSKHFYGDTFENDAEHSWHIAMMALIFSEYSNEKLDIAKVVKMVLIHDIVEIDAGDIIVYDKTPQDSINELNGAKRIFGILPEDQKKEYLDLWLEFEDRKTPEAKFAQAVDRMQPVLENIQHGGETWGDKDIDILRVININKKIDDGSHFLWEYIKSEIENSFSK